jgi:hypothetical protein
VRNFLGSLTRKYVRATAYFVTTSTFTEPAKRFVVGEQVELVDAWKLVEYVRLAEKNRRSIAFEKIANICPTCGSNLVERKGRRVKFIGCSSYPKCNFTRSLD